MTNEITVIEEAIESITYDLSTKNRRFLVKLQQVLSLLSTLDKEMPIQRLMLLVEIALADTKGVSSQDIRQSVGMSGSTVSRNVGLLGEFSRGDKQALGLISQGIDYTDRRTNVLKLSPKGQKIFNTIFTIINR